MKEVYQKNYARVLDGVYNSTILWRYRRYRGRRKSFLLSFKWHPQRNYSNSIDGMCTGESSLGQINIMAEPAKEHRINTMIGMCRCSILAS